MAVKPSLSPWFEYSCRHWRGLVAGSVAVVGCWFVAASQLQAAPQGTSPAQQQAIPPAAPPPKPLTKKQVQQQRKKLENELSKTYKEWLNEDVPYIITDDERAAFLGLQTDEERDNFIDEFWQRRNPDPESTYNSYKEEHYRRIAYANEHFAAGEPGWKTDRGRIYIVWGAPDEKDDHDAGGTYSRPVTEGGGTTSTFPFEDWTYNYLEGAGAGGKGLQNVKIEFVDTCMCGEYHYSTDPEEKDALLYVPGAGLSIEESMGIISKDARFTRADGTHLPGDAVTTSSDSEFEVLERSAAIFAPPAVKFHDLEEVVSHNIVYNLLPFQVRNDYVKVTNDTVEVPFTIDIPDHSMTFKESNHVQQAKVNIFLRISTINGRTVDSYTESGNVDIPSELLGQYATQTVRYWHAALLKPGNYRVDVVLEDANAEEKKGTQHFAIHVPHYDDDLLSTSTIILADDIQNVLPKNIGAGEFILGDTKVRPVVNSVFKQGQTMGIWMQIYSLKLDPATKKPSATIDFRIDNLNDPKAAPLLKTEQQSNEISNAANQMTIERTLPLSSVPPGSYKLTITVLDNLTKQQVTNTAAFTISAMVAKP